MSLVSRPLCEAKARHDVQVNSYIITVDEYNCTTEYYFNWGHPILGDGVEVSLVSRPLCKAKDRRVFKVRWASCRGPLASS